MSLDATTTYTNGLHTPPLLPERIDIDWQWWDGSRGHRLADSNETTHDHIAWLLQHAARMNTGIMIVTGGTVITGNLPT